MTAPVRTPCAGPGEGVAALILAAGGGSRMGGPKALLESRGRALVEHSLDAALDGGCAPALVVLGAAADRVRRRTDLRRARIVVNQGWREGMGSSLRAGLGALTASGDGEGDGGVIDTVDAALVLLVDQPFIGADAVRAVLGAWREGARLAAASYGGRRGHPVLLGREHWAAVARQAVGDAGARGYLASRARQLVLVPCDTLADPRDLDVPADLDG